MVRDLMEPIAVRATEDREQVNEAKRQLTFTNKRVTELEYIIYRGNDKNTIFDDLYNRINLLVRNLAILS